MSALTRGPGAAPEARQVAGDLDRPLRRRQQVQDQRHAAAGDRRVPVEAEQFLHAHGQDRALRRRHSRSAMREPVGTSTWVGASASRRRFRGQGRRAAGPRREVRRRCRRGPCGRGDAARASPPTVAPRASSERSGHSSPSARRRNIDPVAPLRQRLRPGQRRRGRATASPRARTLAASSVAGTGSGRSARTRAP